MTMVTTLVLAAMASLVAGFCIWHQHRERDRPLGEVSLFPSTVVMILAVLVLILALAHLVTLMTGVPLKGRMGF